MAGTSLARSDAAALAYAVLFARVLRDRGFADPAAARDWVAYWLASPDDEPALAQVARRLTVRLMAAEVPLAVAARVHAEVSALEVQHMLAAPGVDPVSVGHALAAANERLVLLLASIEGERVCAQAPSGTIGAMGDVADQLAEATRLITRSLHDLRASAGAQPSARQHAA